MIAKAIRILFARGPVALVYAVRLRLQGFFNRRATSFPECLISFEERKGLEIGGPSPAFSARGLFPVYPVVASLDNCNFRDTTVWQGTIKGGSSFHFDRNRPPGNQYVSEATDMRQFVNEEYDFMLASHVLEHVANPVRALLEWQRIVRVDGLIVLILPDRRHTFDHRRSVTTLEHLLNDYQSDVGEDDLTHLQEIIALHDLDRDPEAGDAEAFARRSQDNLAHRCLHHHVFDADLVRRLIQQTGMSVVAVETLPPYHIVAIARKITNPKKSVVAI
jgi:SAM-dependent methyltransferase